MLAFVCILLVIFLISVVYIGLNDGLTPYIPVEKLFLAAAIPLAAAFFLLVPPWSTNDSDSHYLACYRLSNLFLGQFGSRQWLGRADDVAFYKNTWWSSTLPSIGSYEVIKNNLQLFAKNKELVEMTARSEKMNYYSAFCYIPQTAALVIGRLIGFDLPQNFDHPYMSKNISEFWRRWHITLGMWFRNYVYIPMGGNRCSQQRQLLNLATVWLLTGLWHGASWSFVFWGIYHGAFVVLEKFVIKDRLDILPKGVRVFFSSLIVFVGWIFFFSPTLGSAFHYIGQIFGGGHMGFIDKTAMYYLTGNLILLIAAFIGCGPLVRNLYHKYVYVKKPTMVYLSILVYAALFAFCIAGMVSSTFSSFLYAQF